MSHGGGGDDGGGERWLISYADFITLLMVMFVVLYSMSQIDVKKYMLLAQGLRVAFSGGPESIVDPQINQGGALSEEEMAAPIQIPGMPKRNTGAEEVAGELTSMLTASQLGGLVSVQNNVEGVLISLSEKILYVPGTAELQPEAYPVLDAVAGMVKDMDNDLKITGYTDDTPPQGDQYSDNWELSMARALKIVDYFQAAGLPPERLIAAGRGEYKPLFPNDTPEHRAMNSRADIIVVYPVESDIINLNILSSQPEVGPGE